MKTRSLILDPLGHQRPPVTLTEVYDKLMASQGFGRAPNFRVRMGVTADVLEFATGDRGL
jgi:hypothetical protein